MELNLTQLSTVTKQVKFTGYRLDRSDRHQLNTDVHLVVWLATMDTLQLYPTSQLSGIAGIVLV